MSDIGLYCLRFALVFTLLGLGAGLYAGLNRRPDWTQVAERTVYAVFGFVSLAMVALLHAFASDDFQLAYVARSSTRGMPLAHRLAAAWSGQEGASLLGQFLLSGFAGLVVWKRRLSNRSLMPWILVVLLSNTLLFLVITNLFAVPFEKLPADRVLSDGMGLDPLLQHDLMAVQPVVLYAGFVAFAIPFAFAFATLITGELSSAWTHVTRRWTLFAWLMLGLAQLIGARWAYETSSWEAWEPLKNAPLMPWLASTAYLHSVVVQEKRDMLKTWNPVLIGLTYTLCLFGTLLTAAGAVQSASSMTASRGFEWSFLIYMVLIGATFAVAIAARRNQLESTSRLESMLSREAGVLVTNCVLMLLLLGVFVGALSPGLASSAGGEQITTGPDFSAAMTRPLALSLLLFMGLGPLLAWRRTTATDLRRRITPPAAVAIATGLATAVGLRGTADLWTLGYWTLAGFTAAAIGGEYWLATKGRIRQRGEAPLRAVGALLRRHPRRYWGYLVHLGVVLMMLGLSGAAFKRETLEKLYPGQSTIVGDYRLEYLTATETSAQRYGGERARLTLYRDGAPVGVMLPERRMHWLQEQTTSVPAIYSRLNEDLYVVLEALEPDGAATLEISLNPLVNWIWIGGSILLAACIGASWPPKPRRDSTWLTS